MPNDRPLEMQEAEYLVWLATTTDARGLKRAIGGSAIGALLGMNRYKTAADVWDDLLSPRARVENRHKDRGTRMEPIIRDIYREETSRDVYEVPPTTMLFNGAPFRSMPDGHIAGSPSGELNEIGIFEAKCPDQFGYQEVLANGIDPSYYAQVQQYAMIDQASWAGFGIFNVVAWELHTFDVAADGAMQNDIVRVGSRFWNEHILTRQRPSERAVEGIVARMPLRLGADAVLLDDPEIVTLVSDLQISQEEANIVKSRVDMLKTKIQERMTEANAEVIRVGPHRISWKEVTRRSLDKDLLEAAGIDPAPFYKVSVSRTFLPRFG